MRSSSFSLRNSYNTVVARENPSRVGSACPWHAGKRSSQEAASLEIASRACVHIGVAAIRRAEGAQPSVKSHGRAELLSRDFEVCQPPREGGGLNPPPVAPAKPSRQLESLYREADLLQALLGNISEAC
ncbi:Hypothetical predicted protein [Podarcis lilfordi]|uniref:Uncharacterized protein n=1 Tax=Podarcis lilfordi TaxID=74358 RepID=A0AA35PB13_9SAUR|nr:Hypothetical predicted protein [Podarcis lilfordi]